MPRPAFPKTLREFQSMFATEDACRKYCLKSSGDLYQVASLGGAPRRLLAEISTDAVLVENYK